jgi:hypothetical protein
MVIWLTTRGISSKRRSSNKRVALQVVEARTSMYCTKCGTQSAEGDGFCQKCGSPLNRTATQMPPTTPTSSPTPVPAPTSTPPVAVYVQGPAASRRTSGLAVASLVLGLLGISILALIFGGVAMGQTGRDPNLSGRGMAVAGFVLGLIGLIIEVFWVVFAVGVLSSLSRSFQF